METEDFLEADFCLNECNAVWCIIILRNNYNNNNKLKQYINTRGTCNSVYNNFWEQFMVTLF